MFINTVSRGRLLPAGTRHAWLLLLLLAASGPSASWGQSGQLENVVVVGRKPVGAGGAQLHGFASFVSLDEQQVVPQNVAQLVARQPGVAYNGQGGQLQTVSVRGLSRQRVGSYFLDIPLLTERRAGSAASFIDPNMLQAVELVRGPASTAYGSGNIGGLLRSLPQTGPLSELRFGWGGSGNENNQLLRLGGELGYLALSRRAADNAETPDGEPLHTEHEQYNLLLGGAQQTDAARYELVALLADGSDIGKSNSRYPDQRVTSYPEERHWLTQLSRVTERSLTAVFAQSQELETRVLRPGERRDEVNSSSLDFGARYVHGTPGDVGWRGGVDYLGRRDVDIDEQRFPSGEPPEGTRAALRGEQAASLSASQLLLLGDSEGVLPKLADEGLTNPARALFWGDWHAALRGDPRFIRAQERSGALEAWRALGPPPACREEGDQFVCGQLPGG